MKADGGTMERRYWIGVVSRSHIMIGTEGSFVQLNHGKREPLRRFHAGDGLLIYSPRESYPDGAPLQAFTAAGIIRTGEIYQGDMGDGFMPYRVDVDYLPCHETPIRPLIDELSFIRKKKSWGAAFRFGLLQVPEQDFALITGAMECTFPAGFFKDPPAA